MSTDVNRRLGYLPWKELSENQQNSIKSALELDDLGTDWAQEFWWRTGTGEKSVGGWECTNPKRPMADGWLEAHPWGAVATHE